jgi:hypothetical protein
MHFVSRIVWLNLYADLFGWTCILDYLVEHVCWIILKLLVLACPRLFLICMWYYFVAACINELYSCQSRVNWTTHTDKTQLWISECHSSRTPSTDSSSSTQSQLQLDFRSGAALPGVGAMPNRPIYSYVIFWNPATCLLIVFFGTKGYRDLVMSVVLGGGGSTYGRNKNDHIQVEVRACIVTRSPPPTRNAPRPTSAARFVVGSLATTIWFCCCASSWGREH